MFDISIVSNTQFLSDLSVPSLAYLGKNYDLSEIDRRLNNTLKDNGKIFVVRKNGGLSCFFTYRPLKAMPAWILSNLFIVNHHMFSPNILGFGPAMDQAAVMGEQNNLYSFFWVVDKSTHDARYKIGLRDLNRRNSILLDYTFHIVYDSDIHTGDYNLFDGLTNKTPNTYIIYAIKNFKNPSDK